MWPSHLDFQRRNTGSVFDCLFVRPRARHLDLPALKWSCVCVGGGVIPVSKASHISAGLKLNQILYWSRHLKKGREKYCQLGAYLASRDTFLDIFDMHILCSTYLHIWIDVWGLDISMPLREGYGWNQDISASASKKWMRYIIWKLQLLECVFWDG